MGTKLVLVHQAARLSFCWPFSMSSMSRLSRRLGLIHSVYMDYVYELYEASKCYGFGTTWQNNDFYVNYHFNGRLDSDHVQSPQIVRFLSMMPRLYLFHWFDCGSRACEGKLCYILFWELDPDFLPAQTTCERSGRDVFGLYNHINCLIVCRSGRLITQCFAKASRPIIYTHFSWQIKLGSEKVF